VQAIEKGPARIVTRFKRKWLRKTVAGLLRKGGV
jgi:hypothetical protein